MKTRIMVIMCLGMFCASNLLANNNEKEVPETFLQQTIKAGMRTVTKGVYAAIGAGSQVALPLLSADAKTPAVSKKIAVGIFALLTAAHYREIAQIPDQALSDQEYKSKARRHATADILINASVAGLAAVGAVFFPVATVPAFGGFLLAEFLCSGEGSIMQRSEEALANGLGYLPFI